MGEKGVPGKQVLVGQESEMASSERGVIVKADDDTKSREESG